MQNIKIRYVAQDDKKSISIKIFTLAEIELGRHLYWLALLPGEKVKIIARDLFTGLQDKTGKDVYEGDIVKGIMDFGIGDSKRPGKECVFVVEKRLSGWGFEFILKQITVISENYRGLPNFNETEIVGNNHQNSELLK